MFCGHCGTKMEKIQRFCTECGKEQLRESPLLPGEQSEEPALSHGQPASQELSETGNNKMAIGLIASICAGIVLLICLALFLIFRGGNVEVPDLSNLTKDEAIRLIEESRLSVGDITEEYSGRVDEGLVISHSPMSGMIVGRGSSVNLTISLGTILVEVPELTDLYLLDAADIIRELGLTLVVIEEYSETTEDGMVISQSIPAGNMVEMGAGIDLVVSIGSEFLTVPDFTGLTEDEAVELIQSLNLTLGNVDEEYDETHEEGLVIGQSLRAGTLATRDDSVDLVISLGAGLLSVNPFNIDVWGEDQIITLVLDDVSIDVPIPPWLNEVIYESRYDENYEFADGMRGFIQYECNFYLVNRERDDLMTMIEVRLFNYTGDFQEAAGSKLDFMISFLSGLESISSITDTTIFYQSNSELTAGISSIEYSRFDNDQRFSGFELVKINNYNGILILTRLRIETVDAPEDMCIEEFAYAFGLWRYIDAGYIRIDP